MGPTNNDIQHLNAGHIMAYPTETIWGLGVLAHQATAISNLLELKGRSAQRALSILVSDKFQARSIVYLNPRLESLLEIFWPGPVTFVLPSKDKDLAQRLGDIHFVGLRCSSHPFVQSLVNQLEAPLVTTSVNRSGESPARSRSELNWLPTSVRRACGEVLGGGDPSLVVKVEENQFSILRENSCQEAFETVATEFGFTKV